MTEEGGAAIPIWLEGVRGEQILPLISLDDAAIRVEAGPGTGKTFGLLRRVTRLVHPDGSKVRGRSILICAFNRAIAGQLKEELEAGLGKLDLDLPEIRTVHGLCAQMTGGGERFLLPHEVEIMVYDVRQRYPDLNEALGGKQASVMAALRAHEAGLEQHADLANAVQGWLDDHKADMVGDLPRKVEKLLVDAENDGMPRYTHVIVDEFQDLTETEVRLVLRLRTDDGKFIALGDPKQSIYAFRGNDKKGLAALDDLIEAPIRDVPMSECQRCPSAIVVLANALTTLEGSAMTAARDEVGQVHRVTFPTVEQERDGMANEIVRVRLAKPSAKHLVLVTRRQFGYDLKEAIAKTKSGVTAETVFAEDILETWPVREAFMFLSILADPDDPAAIRAWLAYRTVLDGKKFKAPGRNAPAYQSLCAALTSSLSVDALLDLTYGDPRFLTGSGRAGILERMARLRDLWSKTNFHGEPDDVLAEVLSSDLWVTYKDGNSSLARADLGRLLGEASAFLDSRRETGPKPTLHDLVRDLRTRIATREQLGVAEPADVEIVTAWGAKGLTADYVYVVGLCDQALPGKFDPESGQSASDHLHEQRRLLYVSVTRAKTALVISRPLKIKPGASANLGFEPSKRRQKYYWLLDPCCFFDHLDSTVLCEETPAAKWAGVDFADADAT